MILASDLVDWSALGEVAYISAGAGLAVALSMGIGVVSEMRAQDASGGTTLALRGVAVVAVLLVVAAVAFGIYFITDK